MSTSAGDEIGWDFVSSVRSSKISFTAFCNEMTRKYKTNNILSSSFMCPATFIKWFFSWIAQMKIDFRKHVYPWCKFKPEKLACDGTHIGVSLKQLKLKGGITKPDLQDNILKPVHKR